ncbi:MAG: asparagine synthase (glutamine-hydrolyzing) [Sulfuricella sp.]|nr:asparagine synthase (glutamine-hydrolyzing) [Sulfuricella sp.]
MCGLAGFLNLNGGLNADTARAVASAMGAVLHHRGPDDSGIWEDAGQGVALAHRRLSIVDLSPEGHQPMVSACGRYVVAFNGEIYNHLALRRDLEGANGAPAWRGYSDTETLLAAIAYWGLEPALQRFVGMFALALWDRLERTLHLARDRFGEKPLYYGRMGNVFLFGSELKALQQHPAWRGEIDRGSLALFMRYAYVPAPYSIYKGVAKLPPGNCISLGPTSWGDGSPQPYWTLRNAAEAGVRRPFSGTPDAAIDVLDGLLRQAIASQMVADVPLGAFLSGGIDSSLVVALMQAQSARPVKTFTIGFEDPSYNEAEHAKAVARHLGTEHTELYVRSDQARDVIPRLSSIYDEPFADSSQIPTFLVAQLARRHVTVSLSGDGGDELFGGYNRYLWADRIWHYVKRFPKPGRLLLAQAITLLPPQAWDGLFRFAPKAIQHRLPGDKMHKLADVLKASGPEEIYRNMVSHWGTQSMVVQGGHEPSTTLSDPANWADVPEFVQRIMFLDGISYLPDDILVKVDRATMAVGLEGRTPLLDHRVAEFAWQLPLELKIHNGISKWPLRQVLYRYVPEKLIERPKMGFGVPIGTWLRGPLNNWAEDLLDESRLVREGFLNPVPIRKAWQEHLSGRRNWQYRLWNVLMFEEWLTRQEKRAVISQ